MKIVYQFLRFTGVGVTCFAIDYGIMVLLTEVFEIKYLYSTGISFTIATVINYFFSSKFVFEHKNRTKFDIFIFIFMGMIGLGINQMLMWWLVEKIAIIYLIAKVISGVIVSFYNFITRKAFLERGSI